MKNVLWMSALAPYDKVPHAGGKIHNWYLKRLNESDAVNIRVITFCKPEEKSKIDLNEYGIDYDVYVRPRQGIVNELKRVLAFASKVCIWNNYAGLVPLDYQVGMKKLLKKAQNSGFIPDVIILQWTEILFFLPQIKRIWPNAKYIAIEEDVSYLGQLRKSQFYRNIILNRFYIIKHDKVRNLEISYLNSVDYAIFNNKKDLSLVIKDGFCGRYYVWAPFYQQARRENDYLYSKKLVFYGAMNREENWKSAIWFIKNVMPNLSDLDIVFEVIGANPNKKLLKYQNEKVLIKGFVPDIEEELSNALCMVAPLVLGAGVKIKVLEAMSIGLPILTNEIGIEGIPVANRKEYFFCASPKDYEEIIRLLLMDSDVRRDVGSAAKAFVTNNLNFKGDSKIFNELVLNL